MGREWGSADSSVAVCRLTGGGGGDVRIEYPHFGDWEPKSNCRRCVTDARPMLRYLSHRHGTLRPEFKPTHPPVTSSEYHREISIAQKWRRNPHRVSIPPLPLQGQSVDTPPLKCGRCSGYACGNPLRWRLTGKPSPSARTVASGEATIIKPCTEHFSHTNEKTESGAGQSSPA